MKASIAKTKAKNALVFLSQDKSQLNGIRPSTAMEQWELFEIFEIIEKLDEVEKRVDALVKGGEK